MRKLTTFFLLMMFADAGIINTTRNIAPSLLCGPSSGPGRDWGRSSVVLFQSCPVLPLAQRSRPPRSYLWGLKTEPDETSTMILGRDGTHELFPALRLIRVIGSVVMLDTGSRLTLLSRTLQIATRRRMSALGLPYTDRNTERRVYSSNSTGYQRRHYTRLSQSIISTGKLSHNIRLCLYKRCVRNVGNNR